MRDFLGLTEAARSIETAVAADLDERGSAPRPTPQVGDAIAKRAAG